VLLVWVLLHVQAKPGGHFIKKYGRPKSFNIMPVNSIRMFGRQLLETLRFLYDKGFPYGQYREMIITWTVSTILEDDRMLFHYNGIILISFLNAMLFSVVIVQRRQLKSMSLMVSQQIMLKFANKAFFVALECIAHNLYWDIINWIFVPWIKQSVYDFIFDVRQRHW